MSNSIDQQKEYSTQDSEEADPENILYRNRQKEKLENNSWTQAILEDVRMYRSIILKKESRNGNSNRFYATEIFTSDHDPEDALEKFRSNSGTELHKRSSWRRNSTFSPDGSFEFGGQKYMYQEKMRPVAVISSSKNNGYKKYTEVSKITNYPVETFNYLSEKVGRTILIGESRVGGTMLRTDGANLKGKEVTINSRTKYMATGISATLITGILLSATLLNGFSSLFLLSVLGLVIWISLGFFGSVKLAYDKTKSLYDVNDLDWLRNIPNSAVVRSSRSKGKMYDNFNIENVDVEAYENGDIRLIHDSSEWIFEGKGDEIPNEKVHELFDQYGLNIVGGEKEFAIADSSDIVMPSKVSYYESQDGQKILMTREQYKQMRKEYC